MADRRLIVSGLADDPMRTVIELYNDLVTKYEAVLAKLDADAGVTDTNYASLHGNPDKILDANTGSEV